jgi:hypothetical protein
MVEEVLNKRLKEISEKHKEFNVLKKQKEEKIKCKKQKKSQKYII